MKRRLTEWNKIARDHGLTNREHEILRMISQARTNRDIGQALSIAEATVKRHSHNVNRKLGATSRMDAVRRASLLGIL